MVFISTQLLRNQAGGVNPPMKAAPNDQTFLSSVLNLPPLTPDRPDSGAETGNERPIREVWSLLSEKGKNPRNITSTLTSRLHWGEVSSFPLPFLFVCGF